MAAGPYEERLRAYVDPARRRQVLLAQERWRTGADQLKAVADAIAEARPLADATLGNHTADAADRAFVEMRDTVLAREQQMRDGSVALRAAIEAIGRAEAVRHGFDAEGPLAEPPAPGWDDDEVRRIQQVRAHHAEISAYRGLVAAREEAARAAIQDLDSTNRSSAETMRAIQGDRPGVASEGGGSGDGARPSSASGAIGLGVAIRGGPVPRDRCERAIGSSPRTGSSAALGRPPGAAGRASGAGAGAGRGASRRAGGMGGGRRGLRTAGRHGVAGRGDPRRPGLGRRRGRRTRRHQLTAQVRSGRTRRVRPVAFAASVSGRPLCRGRRFR